jgi:hypothetical protein
VSFGSATEGCVAIREGVLDRVMRWLAPNLHPIISIGVGSKALAPVESTG